ncbi:MAG: hypothetical protein ACW99A_03800 [Candidatus Kariarchaeaceae archaeon]|jgi:hypothetical protein
MSDFDQILKNVGRGEYDIALEKLNQIPVNQQNRKKLLLATIKLRKNEFNEALEILNEFDNVSANHPLTLEIFKLLTLKVDVLWFMGNFDEAWKQISKIKTLLSSNQEFETELLPVISYLKGRNIAGVKSTDSALTHYQQAQKMFSKSSFQYYNAWNTNRIGVVSDSIPELEDSLTMFRELDEIQGIANCLLNLTDQYLMRGKMEIANHYFNQLKDLDLKDPFVRLQYNLIRGMLLNQSERMRDKARAQLIFEDILDDPMVDRKAKYLALIYLIELNIFEIKASNSKSVLQSTISLVEDFKQIGIDNNNPFTICDSLIFQSKLQMIEGDLSKAKTHLQEAKKYANQTQQQNYIEKIETAEQDLETEILKWGNIIQDDVTLAERILKSKIEGYLPEALKLLKTFDED